MIVNTKDYSFNDDHPFSGSVDYVMDLEQLLSPDSPPVGLPAVTNTSPFCMNVSNHKSNLSLIFEWCWLSNKVGHSTVVLDCTSLPSLRGNLFINKSGSQFDSAWWPTYWAMLPGDHINSFMCSDYTIIVICLLMSIVLQRMKLLPSDNLPTDLISSRKLLPNVKGNMPEQSVRNPVQQLCSKNDSVST